MSKHFGTLTANNSHNEYVNDFKALDYLFSNSKKELKALTVIEAERKIALENLNKLTTELQTKRLRYKVKSSCKYFTL